MLQIFDSVSKKKLEFKPIISGKVSIYVCGNTVYDYCHMGHARSMILFDVITRYLRATGWDVRYVRNITDVDDKIIKRAAENSESCDALTARFIAAQREDEINLGIAAPDHEPRATEFIEPMIVLIEQMIARGHAYAVENGDVYFDVRSFKDYGKLSHRNIDDLREGTRIEIGELKRDPLDFALWKSAKPGEPQWDSPWGPGRPGWHIECSAMSVGLLGQPFDIHGGGLDLKFPHHENEIAQSESVCDKGFAHYWMHVGLLQINKEKMSKSLGNFLTIRDALEQYPPEVIRYFMVSSHYRSPVNYSEENMTQMQEALKRLYTAIDGLTLDGMIQEYKFKSRFNTAMDDDFNTPEALAILFEMSREINRLKEAGMMAEAVNTAIELKELGGILGFLKQNPVEFLRGDRDSVFVSEIEALITQRNEARAQKNWARADEIRDQLLAKNIEILDNKEGTAWRNISKN